MNSLEKSSDIDVDRAKWETKVFGAFALIALIDFSYLMILFLRL